MGGLLRLRKRLVFSGSFALLRKITNNNGSRISHCALWTKNDKHASASDFSWEKRDDI